MVEEEGEDYGYGEFTSGVDTYIVGRGTYDVIRKLCGGEFPQSKQYYCYTITRQSRDAENGVQFYSGELKELIQELRSKEGGNIYCDGGAEIVKLLMESDLIDEYIISIIPIFLGDRKPLFKGGTPQYEHTAESSCSFKSGLVQVHYKRKR